MTWDALTVDAESLEALKADLLNEWDRQPQKTELGSGSGTRFESLSVRRPRGGFAVGHGSDHNKGRVWLELRVTAASGPNYERARGLAARAQAQGVEAVLRVFRRPVIFLTGAPGAAAKPAIGGKRRPLHIGASVAHELGFAGTLGAFLRLEDGGTGIISCAHVLARAGGKRAYKDDPIQQPGAPDPVVASNRIGSLTDQFSLFSPAQHKNLDAAIARLNDGTDHQGNTLPSDPCVPANLHGKPIGVPLQRYELDTNTAVIKVGRTTGFTAAKVSGIGFQVQVALGSETSRQVFSFSGVDEIEWDAKGSVFTAPGDSGALVLTSPDLRPVGLHFCAIGGANGAGRSYVIPWWCIHDIFEVRLL